MARKRRRLTRRLIRDISERLKAGAFEQVAAESLGIPYPVYRRWLDRGQNDERGVYQEFFQAVQQARAHARLMAEMDLRNKDPKVWLLHGPGKEAEGLPGWTSPVKGDARADEPVNVLLQPEIVALLETLQQALAPFPEARAAVAQALAAAAPPLASPDPSTPPTPADGTV